MLYIFLCVFWLEKTIWSMFFSRSPYTIFSPTLPERSATPCGCPAVLMRRNDRVQGKQSPPVLLSWQPGMRHVTPGLSCLPVYKHVWRNSNSASKRNSISSPCSSNHPHSIWTQPPPLSMQCTNRPPDMSTAAP